MNSRAGNWLPRLAGAAKKELPDLHVPGTIAESDGFPADDAGENNHT